MLERASGARLASGSREKHLLDAEVVLAGEVEAADEAAVVVVLRGLRGAEYTLSARRGREPVQRTLETLIDALATEPDDGDGPGFRELGAMLGVTFD